MAINPLSAAKRMCERSDWSISNLELQKILYIAHMYNLGLKDAPLVSGRFEAWDYGPVQPEIYHRVKIYGARPIRNIFRSVSPAEDCPEKEMLDAAVDQLKDAKPGALVAATHWVKGAWAKHYAPGARNVVIPNEDIRQEYFDRQEKIKNERQVAS